jgi:N-acetylmuramoyl-L-alanine amidase
VRDAWRVMRVWDTRYGEQSSVKSAPSPASWSLDDAEETRGRRLSESERRAIRARREARTVHGGSEVPEATQNGRGTARPVPRMPKTRQDTRVKSPAITLAGTLLIVGLTVLAFAGGRLFGRVEETPVALVESQVAQAPAKPVAPPTADATYQVANSVAPSVETPIPLPSTFGRAPIVCLDPGHGGPDRGFTGFFDNGIPSMEEATLVLEQAWDLQARLEHRGYTVVLTRETDAAVNVDGRDVNGDGRTAAHDPPGSTRNKDIDELQARINKCNDANADLLVSMHVNGYSNGNPRGPETWFTRERQFGDLNAEFATLAYAHLKEQLGLIGYVEPDVERGVLPDTTANVQLDRALFQHFIVTGPAVPGVIVPSKMPGAIVETLFVSNDVDATVLGSQEGHDAIVTAYENAIVEYFDRHPPEAK